VKPLATHFLGAQRNGVNQAMYFLTNLFGGSQSSNRSSQADLPPSMRELRPGDYGPFAAFWRDRPTAYLSFLGMSSPDVQPALSSLSDVLRSNPDGPRYIEVMLQSRNWRPHLVASVAALLSHDRAHYAAALWRTFDHGSWVAPQLAVALYFLDPEFRREAKDRIVGRCPVRAAPDLPAIERNVRSRNLASLLRVLSYLPSEANWVVSELERSEVRALLKADCDSSGDIAAWWFTAVQTEYRKLGCHLTT
jgi:hypothetical protein